MTIFQKVVSLFAGFVIAPLPLFSISAEQNKTPVVTYSVVETAFSDRIEALGNLQANESVVLASPVTDVVSEIRFEDGQRVEASSILVEMTNAEETALLEEARSRVEEAKRQYSRVRELVAKKAASESLIDQRRRDLETTQAQLKAIQSRLQDRLVIAPFSGVVGLRNISVGTLLQPGDRITTLDDDSMMKLDFSVPTRFLSTLRRGLEVEAKTDALPGHSFKGTVSSLDSRADEITRSVLVRAILDNQDRFLKPGMLMTVELRSNDRTSLAIPEEALLMAGESSYVYVVGSGGEQIVEKRVVEVGKREPGVVEILTGLKKGDEVIVRGIQQVREGAPIIIKETVGLRGDVTLSTGQDVSK